VDAAAGGGDESAQPAQRSSRSSGRSPDKAANKIHRHADNAAKLDRASRAARLGTSGANSPVSSKVRAGGAASPPRPPLTEENRAATSSFGPVSPQSDSGSPEPPRKSLRVESPPLGRGGAFPSGAPLGFEPRRSLRSGRLTRSASLPAVSSPSGVSLGAQASSPSKLDGAAPRDESSGTPPRRGPGGGL
jgi:hypothetical protein